MIRSSAGRSLAGLVAISALAPLAAAGIRIADAPELGLFSSLQAAIDAAPDRGLLLVHSGPYGAATIDGKSLSIVEMPGAVAITNGRLTIRNLAAGQRVLVSGLEIRGVNAPGVSLVNDHGDVRFQGCTITGGRMSVGENAVGLAGVSASMSTLVVLTKCAVYGGDAGYNSGYPGLPGGDGLSTTDSNVALYDCAVAGGTGGEEGVPGGRGGDGCHVVGWGVFASGCTIRGGHGGGGDYIGCTTGGAGGDAVDVTNGQAQLYDTVLSGGNGGWSPCSSPGSSGMPVVTTGGVVNQFPGPARKITGARLASDDSTIAITVIGQPGDRAYLVRSTSAGYAYQASWHGVWTVPRPAFIASEPLGIVPASGSLTVSVSTKRLEIGVLHQLWFMQAYCIDVAGARWLTGALDVEHFDRAGGPDCNGNGINDFSDLIEIPNVDCNRNVALDACDIATGISKDCDLDGAPDSCEIATGAERDCNDNDSPDDCDIAAGVASDCNGDAIPDSCNIATGASFDVNGNGVPDECEPGGGVTFWVDASATPGGNGTSSNPFRTIQEGIAASFHGDTVMIRDGVYVGASNRNLDPAGRAVLIRSENGPAACIIDCQNAGRAFSIDTDEGPSTIVQGLTIRNGNGSAASHDTSHAGAIFVDRADPVIRGCVFESCRARLGGAIWALVTSIRIESCVFRNCVGTSVGGDTSQGGAMMLSGGAANYHPIVVATDVIDCTADRGAGLHIGGYGYAIVSRCRFIGNVATHEGGAVYASSHGSVDQHFLRMDDCLIAGNRAASGGGVAMTAVYPYSPLPAWTFAGCTFAGNSATTSGGALRVWSSLGGTPPLEIHDTILWNNVAPIGAEFLHTGAHTEIRVLSSDVQGGQGAFYYDATASFVWGPGNVDADPLFRDADGVDDDPLTFADNDYRLGSFSPCIDAGDNGLVAPDLLDADGDGDVGEPIPQDLGGLARFVDVASVPDTGSGTAPIVDIGAFEKER